MNELLRKIYSLKQRNISFSLLYISWSSISSKWPARFFKLIFPFAQANHIAHGFSRLPLTTPIFDWLHNNFQNSKHLSLIGSLIALSWYPFTCIWLAFSHSNWSKQNVLVRLNSRKMESRSISFRDFVSPFRRLDVLSYLLICKTQKPSRYIIIHSTAFL